MVHQWKRAGYFFGYGAWVDPAPLEWYWIDGEQKRYILVSLTTPGNYDTKGMYL